MDDDDPLLLPELQAIVHTLLKNVSLAERARCRLVSREWLSRDPDLAWQRHHPDIVAIYAPLRPEFDVIMATVEALGLEMPAPTSINTSGTLIWRVGEEIESLSYGRAGFQVHGQTCSSCSNDLLYVLQYLCWWPGDVLWVSASAHVSRGTSLIPIMQTIFEQETIRVVAVQYVSRMPRELWSWLAIHPVGREEMLTRPPASTLSLEWEEETFDIVLHRSFPEDVVLRRWPIELRSMHVK